MKVRSKQRKFYKIEKESSSRSSGKEVQEDTEIASHGKLIDISDVDTSLSRFDKALEEITYLKVQADRLNEIKVSAESHSSSARMSRILETEAKISSLLGEIDSHFQTDAPASVSAIPALPNATQSEASPPAIIRKVLIVKDDLQRQLGNTWVNYLAYSPPSKLLQKYAMSDLSDTLTWILERFDSPSLSADLSEIDHISEFLTSEISQASYLPGMLSFKNVPEAEMLDVLQQILQIFLEKHDGAEITHQRSFI